MYAGCPTHDRCCDTAAVTPWMLADNSLFFLFALGPNHPCRSRPNGSLITAEIDTAKHAAQRISRDTEEDL